MSTKPGEGHFGIRPGQGASAPEKTNGQYCVYDNAHRDYLYTTAWIDKLVTELSDADTYKTVVGKAPNPKA